MGKNEQFKDKYPQLYKYRWFIIRLLVSFLLITIVFSCQALLIKRSFKTLFEGKIMPHPSP